jgi:hypothetical protein
MSMRAAPVVVVLALMSGCSPDEPDEPDEPDGVAIVSGVPVLPLTGAVPPQVQVEDDCRRLAVFEAVLLDAWTRNPEQHPACDISPAGGCTAAQRAAGR